VGWWEDVKRRVLGGDAPKEEGAPPPSEPPAEVAEEPAPGEPLRLHVPEDHGAVVFVEQAWKVLGKETPETHSCTILFGKNAKEEYGAYLVGEANTTELVAYRIDDPIAGIYVHGRGHVMGPHTADPEEFEACMVNLGHEHPSFEVVRVK
jgi:hypothetical protein